MSEMIVANKHSSTEDTHRLRESQTRLDILTRVTTAITNGADPNDVFANAVSSLASAFVGCRVYYGDVNAAGQFQASVASPNASVDFGFDLTECEDARSLLKDGRPLILGNVDGKYALGPLSVTLKARGCHALLAVAVLRTRLRVSLVCIAAPEPHAWTKHQIAMVSEVAGALAVLLREARMLQERRLAERSLRRTSKKIVNILECVADAFFEIDGEGRFTYVNPQGEALTGCRHGLLQGQSFLAAFPGLQSTSIGMELDRAVVQHISSAVEEYDRLRGQWLRIQIHALDNGAAVYIHDVTQERRMQEALDECKGRLKRSLAAAAKALFFSVEARDPYTAAHQQRVAALGCGIAHMMGWSREAIEHLRIAGLLHDVGKIGVPTDILHRPCQLTFAEMSIVKTHVQIGYNILSDIEFVAPVALVALQHHERLDGSGYPQGLTADEILPESRIIMVADVVEAMSSHRPYRPALGTERALEEILQNKDARYDVDCVAACVELLRRSAFDLEQTILEQSDVTWL